MCKMERYLLNPVSVRTVNTKSVFIYLFISLYNLLLPTHCGCGGLLLHPITLSDAYTRSTPPEEYYVCMRHWVWSGATVILHTHSE